MSPVTASKRPADAGVALVTGSSRGIGRVVALRLAREGWTIGVNYRADAAGAKETVASIEAAGGRAMLAPGDVSVPDGVDDAIAALEDAGPVLVLVNNAGVRRDGLAAMMSAEAWDDVLRTNLTGSFLVAKRVLRSMLKARWGRIISVSSVVGLRGNPGQANYAAAKAGLVGLTRSLALEVASRGITVNAVAPGLVRTALTENLTNLAELEAATPIGRAVDAEEVAAAVSFLATEEAAAITGQVLCVDGGMSV